MIFLPSKPTFGVKIAKSNKRKYNGVVSVTVVFIITCIVYIILFYNTSLNSAQAKKWIPWLTYQQFLDKCNINIEKGSNIADDVVHIVFVHCQNDTDRIQDVVNAIKSAIYMSQKKLQIHIITDNYSSLLENIDKWSNNTINKFHYTLYSPCFAEDDLYYAFKPCSVQRLFIPFIIHSVDKVLYVDTDSLFLGPPEDVWSYFNNFSPTQLMGLVPETEGCDGWYDGPGKDVPHLAPHGYNAGVMLWDLEKARNDHWFNTLRNISENQTTSSHPNDFVSLADQDIINEYFYLNPDQLYRLPCAANFRSDFCESCDDSVKENCISSLENGIIILHGNRRLFHEDNMFKEIYTMYSQLDQVLPGNKLLQKMEYALSERNRTECPAQIFFKKLLNTLTEQEQ